MRRYSVVVRDYDYSRLCSLCEHFRAAHESWGHCVIEEKNITTNMRIWRCKTCDASFEEMLTIEESI
jgi:hypothetical protein